MSHTAIFGRKEYQEVVQKKFTKGLYGEALSDFEGLLASMEDLNVYDHCILWMRIADCRYALLIREPDGKEETLAAYDGFLEARDRYLDFLGETERTAPALLKENRGDAETLLTNSLELRLAFEKTEDLKGKILSDMGAFLAVPWFGQRHGLPLLLKKMFEERRNFERKGHLEKTEILALSYLELTASGEAFRSSRAQVMNLLSDLAYFRKDERAGEEALRWARQCLEISPEDRFAKAQKKFIEEQQVVQDRIRRFEHDTFSSIAGIRSTLRLLMSGLEGRVDEDAIQKLHTIRRELDRIQGVNRFVADKEPDFREQDIRPLLEDLRGKYGDRAQIRLGGDGGGELDTDAGYLALALDNLLKNAVEAFERKGTPPEERRIDLDVDPEARRIRVRDNAGGIDPLLRSRIFEPYVSSKGIRQQSGLGLSQARMAIEKMEGRLHLCAEQPGDGTCFEILLS